MTIRTTRRTPGQPTWMDLATPDLEVARQFYHQVFGWEYMDLGEQFGHYHYALAHGEIAAGLGQLPPDAQMPSAWTIYLASDDAAADIVRVKELGGQVHLAPMRVGNAGHMAVCADPTGAAFGLWQAVDMVGAAVENEHGGMAWHEVNTPDAAAACAFYNSLFGLAPHKMEGMDYFILQHGDEMVSGVLQMDANWEGIPPHWMGYFAVDNTDAALERVTAAGGKIMVPAFDMAYGRMAVIADPFGATVSVVQLSDGQ